MICNICNQKTTEIFSAKLLQKHIVKYYQCKTCSFIQTEKPYWLNEAYSEAIADLDVGYVYRNITFSKITSEIIKESFEPTGSFLDYGGGYGMFVRLMRDNGFKFFREDLYCPNIFSKHFDIEDIPNNQHFELITSFEVFEHLENPISEIKKMFNYAESILFSTDLQPKQNFTSAADWWYFLPETGQHISFYTKKSLEVIAEQLNCHFYTNNGSLHLLSKKKFKKNPLIIRKYDLIRKILKYRKANPPGLLQSDFEMLRNNLINPEYPANKINDLLP